MKLRRLTLALLASVVPTGDLSADIKIDRTTVHFASPDEGRQILTAKDEFTQRLSPFDRAARMKTAATVAQPEFLQFVARNVRAWTPAEIQKLSAVFEAIQSQLRAVPVSLPVTVQLIKTTGAEEGNAAYTEANAIVLPHDYLSKSSAELQKVVCHELFHVLSRANSDLREKLYTAIGFEKCPEIVLPPALQRRKITNPDAPRNDHFIRLRMEGRDCLAVPILLTRAANYDPKRGGEFFDYLQFLLVEQDRTSGELKIVYEDSAPKLVDLTRLSGFFEQVGRNTTYIIHPEEILADNFALFVLQDPSVPSPEILRKMKDILISQPAS